MRADPENNLGGWSYRTNSNHRRNGFRLGVCFGRRGMDADTVAVERTPLVGHTTSRIEMSSHLAPEAIGRSRRPKTGVGLVDRRQAKSEGEARPLPTDFARRNYSIRLPVRNGRRRRSRCNLRIGALHLCPQSVRGKRAFPANSLPLGRTVRPLQSVGEYPLRLSAFLGGVGLGRVGL